MQILQTKKLDYFSRKNKIEHPIYYLIHKLKEQMLLFERKNLEIPDL